METRYLDLRAACKYTGFGRSTIYHMCQERRIPFIRKAGRLRFDVAELDRWMREDTIVEQHELERRQE